MTINFFLKDFVFSEEEMDEVVFFTKNKLNDISSKMNGDSLDKEEFNAEFNKLCESISVYLSDFKSSNDNGNESLIKSESFNLFMSNFS